MTGRSRLQSRFWGMLINLRAQATFIIIFMYRIYFLFVGVKEKVAKRKTLSDRLSSHHATRSAAVAIHGDRVLC